MALQESLSVDVKFSVISTGHHIVLFKSVRLPTIEDSALVSTTWQKLSRNIVKFVVSVECIQHCCKEVSECENLSSGHKRGDILGGFKALIGLNYRYSSSNLLIFLFLTHSDGKLEVFTEHLLKKHSQLV